MRYGLAFALGWLAREWFIGAWSAREYALARRLQRAQDEVQRLTRIQGGRA